MEQITSEPLKKRYLGFIDYFREEYEKLSTNEKQSMNNSNNFLTPCQIEIFWIADPDYQLIIYSNFKDRPDKEIIINGPFNSHEFRSKAIEILKNAKWTRKTKQEKLPDRFEQRDTYGEEMALMIHRFIETYKNNFVHALPHSPSLGGIAIEDMWVRTYAGNIEKLDYVDEVNKIIQEFKQNAKVVQETKPTPPQQSISVGEQYSGFGVHLFPAVIIGKKHKRTIDELANDTFAFWTLDNKSFDMEIANKRIIVNNDGFIFIESNNKENALKILNLIMSLGIFHELHLYAVRDHELSEVNYDKEKLTTTGMRWNTESRRAFLFEERWNPKSQNHFEKKQVNPTKIKEILSDAEKILPYEKLSEDLRLLNEGMTHINNSEFAQSFIMNWSVIERHYSNFWREILFQKDIEHDRLSKLSNPNQWTIDYILEVLNLQNKIDENSYDLLMELKRKRNRFYHSGKQVTKDDAELCFRYAMKLLVEKMIPILGKTFSNILK